MIDARKWIWIPLCCLALGLIVGVSWPGCKCDLTPPKPPAPKPPVVVVVPSASLRVLTVYESDDIDAMTREQAIAFNSTRIREWLNAHCMKGPDGKTPEWRQLDKDTPLTNESDAWEAIFAAAKDHTPLPAYAVIDGTKIVEWIPLTGEDADLAALSKHGS